MGIIAMYSASRCTELRVARRHSVKGNVFAEGGRGRFRPRQPRERVNSAVDGFSLPGHCSAPTAAEPVSLFGTGCSSGCPSCR